MQKSDEELTKCYFENRMECPDRAECRIGKECLNHASENADDRHYHCSNISVPHVIFDPNEDAKNQDEAISKTYFSAEDENSEPEKDLHLIGISIPQDALPYVYLTLEKISHFYFYTPNVFDALMNSIVKGKNQSDIARDQHITRQWVNKRLLKEIGLAQKRNDAQERRDRELADIKRAYDEKTEMLERKYAFLNTLTEREILIFHLRFHLNLEARIVAEKIGCNIRTVFRATDKIRRGLDLAKKKNGPKPKHGGPA